MKPVHILYAAIVAFLWGSNYLAIKIGLEYFQPYMLLTLRFILVLAMLMPFYPRPPLPFLNILVLSLVLGFGHFVMIYEGMAQGLDVASTIIAAQLNVPFSCALATVFFKDRLGPWRSFGMMVSFFGIILIVGSPSVSAHLGAFSLVMAGAMGWAITNIMLKRQQAVSMLALLPWLSLFLIPQMALFTWLFEAESLVNFTLPWQAAASVVYTAIGSTLIAFGLWHYLLQRYEVSQVAPFTLLVPVFGIGIGQLFMGGALATPVLVGGLVTLLGVGIITVRKPRLATFDEDAPGTIEEDNKGDAA